MNLPNRITMVRVMIVPVLAVLMLFRSTVPCVLSLLLFIAASVSDYVDGHIARSRNLVTDFGKFLDPIADKALVSTALILLIPEGIAPAMAVLIIILREFVISGVRLLATTKGKVVAANMWGKVKTAYTCVALVAIMFLRCFDIDWLQPLGNVLIWIAAAITAVSGIVYVWQNKEIIGI